MTSNKSDISHATELVWPAWTDLIIAPKGLKLTDQVHKLQAVIRQTLKTVKERFVFENSYPGLIKRNSWNQAAIRQACEAMGGFSPAKVKAKYQTIASEHVDADHDYLKEISSLVSHLFVRTIGTNVNDPSLTLT